MVPILAMIFGVKQMTETLTVTVTLTVTSARLVDSDQENLFFVNNFVDFYHVSTFVYSDQGNE